MNKKVKVIKGQGHRSKKEMLVTKYLHSQVVRGQGVMGECGYGLRGHAATVNLRK